MLKQINRSLFPIFGLCSAFVYAATMPPIHMKVIDIHTNQPLTGANVLFHAIAHKGTLTGHGGESTNLFLVETVTNDAGEIKLPAIDFSAQPFLLNTNYHNPSMMILKPGYVAVKLTNNQHIIPQLKEVTNWEYNNQTVNMYRTQNNKEIYQSAHVVSHFIYQTGDKDFCWWEKMPRFLIAADRTAIEWNRKRRSIEEQELRIQNVRSLLQDIMTNAEHFTRIGCNSPKKIFEMYTKE